MIAIGPVITLVVDGLVPDSLRVLIEIELVYKVDVLQCIGNLWILGGSVEDS
jgi:hypothetical protein